MAAGGLREFVDENLFERVKVGIFPAAANCAGFAKAARDGADFWTVERQRAEGQTEELFGEQPSPGL